MQVDYQGRTPVSSAPRIRDIKCEEAYMPEQDIALMAHLLRRAGFGASRAEIEAKAAQGYEAAVAELLHPLGQPTIDEDLMLRYHPTYNHAGAIEINTQMWVYRMINSPRQLQEKMSLFWHMIFCAGHSKIDSGEEMGLMIAMFREHGMGNSGTCWCAFPPTRDEVLPG